MLSLFAVAHYLDQFCMNHKVKITLMKQEQNKRLILMTLNSSVMISVHIQCQHVKAFSQVVKQTFIPQCISTTKWWKHKITFMTSPVTFWGFLLSKSWDMETKTFSIQNVNMFISIVFIRATLTFAVTRKPQFSLIIWIYCLVYSAEKNEIFDIQTIREIKLGISSSSVESILHKKSDVFSFNF